MLVDIPLIGVLLADKGLLVGIETKHHCSGRMRQLVMFSIPPPFHKDQGTSPLAFYSNRAI